MANIYWSFSAWRKKVRKNKKLLFLITNYFYLRLSEEALPAMGNKGGHPKHSSSGRPFTVAQTAFQGRSFLSDPSFVSAKVKGFFINNYFKF